MPLNQTKIDILLTLTELMYYCPHSLVDILDEAKCTLDDPFVTTNKVMLKSLRLMLEEYKKYPSKKGQTR